MACRTERPKRDLVRVVRAASTGELAVDRRGKASGRGAYLCPDQACLERALAEGSVARSLGVPIGADVRDRLHRELESALNERRRT